MFWASKLHFYITGITFYNFPYTFGFLLARWLGARLGREGRSFLPHYEAFLMASGSDTVARVTRRTLGIDITRTSFWADAIQTLEAPLKKYQTLVHRYRSR